MYCSVVSWLSLIVLAEWEQDLGESRRQDIWGNPDASPSLFACFHFSFRLMLEKQIVWCDCLTVSVHAFWLIRYFVVTIGSNTKRGNRLFCSIYGWSEKRKVVGIPNPPTHMTQCPGDSTTLTLIWMLYSGPKQCGGGWCKAICVWAGMSSHSSHLKPLSHF